MPAVSSVWPMFAFTLPIGIFFPAGTLAETSADSAPSSVASPTWVLVAWASM